MRLSENYTSIRVRIERYPGEQELSCHVFATEKGDAVQWIDSFEVGPFDTTTDILTATIRALQRHGVILV